MNYLVNISIGIVVCIHLYIMWFEMFAWTTRGRKVFKQFPKDLFEPTKAMAANQGLYNGFLAAGLIWSYSITNAEWSANVALFFLSCVIVAGVYGTFTASKKILYVQVLPALLALMFLLIHIS